MADPRKSFRTPDFALRPHVALKATLSPKARRLRLLLTAASLLLWVSLIVWRLASIQITRKDTWQEWAVRQHLAEVHLASERGPLLDRHGKLLAVSVPAGSVYARPGQIKDKHAVATALAKTLSLDRSIVEERLTRPSPFVWIERQVPRQVARQVDELKLPGVGFVIESRRYYPFNQAASALVGRVGTDGVGLSGIELRYEKELHGEHQQTTLRKDALGNLIQATALENDEVELPRGNSVSLTIDSGLQLILDEELEKGRSDTNAHATMGVLMDAVTGEILAMGQAPSLNFNTAKISGRSDLKNLVVETVFEPGSIMKPLVAAAALDQGVVSVNDSFDCGHGHLVVGRHTIKDVHPYDVLSLRDVIVRSSNIGMSRIGFRLGRERLHEVLSTYGFGAPSPIDLPGSTNGLLRNASDWAQIDEATHAFGHGFAVTPIQVVRAISAIANGGILPYPKVVLSEASGPVTRVLSERSAATMREMLYGVVEDEKGTGHKAAIEGLRVGGKTGTAERPRDDGRGYEPGSYVASFVGFVDGAPLGLNRTLTLIVVVDRAHTDSIFGGTLAAPIFQRVMRRTMSTLATAEQLGQRPGRTVETRGERNSPAIAALKS